MKNHHFAIFSNTFEEYEAFINAGVFYWPNELSKSTPYQKNLNHIELKEKV